MSKMKVLGASAASEHIRHRRARIFLLPVHHTRWMEFWHYCTASHKLHLWFTASIV